MKTKYCFIPCSKVGGNRVFPHTFIVWCGCSRKEQTYLNKFLTYPNNSQLSFIFEPYNNDFVELILNDGEFKNYCLEVPIELLYRFVFGNITERGNLRFVFAELNSLKCKRCIKKIKSYENEENTFSSGSCRDLFDCAGVSNSVTR